MTFTSEVWLQDIQVHFSPSLHVFYEYQKNIQSKLYLKLILSHVTILNGTPVRPR